MREQFAGITKSAFSQFINERITERLRSAMGEVSLPAEVKSEPDHPGNHQNGTVIPDSEGSKIITTEEELQVYYIVKAIVCSVIGVERVVYRDAQSYFSILCDDNNRKPNCRLHFNGKQKYIGLLNADKGEEKMPIDNLNEIYKFAGPLKTTVELYVK